MKQIIFLFLFFCFTDAKSQDLYIDIQYKGIENGSHKVQIVNYQNCPVDIKLVYQGGNATTILPNTKNSIFSTTIRKGTSFIYLTGNITGVKIKAETICDWKGENPKFVNLEFYALPVKYIKKSFRVVREIKITSPL